jgi:hypothetical protein
MCDAPRDYDDSSTPGHAVTKGKPQMTSPRRLPGELLSTPLIAFVEVDPTPDHCPEVDTPGRSERQSVSLGLSGVLVAEPNVYLGDALP